MSRSSLAAHVVTAVLAFVAGAAGGAVLTFTHRQYVVDVLGLAVPLGLVGGLAILAALLTGMRLAFGGRLAPVAAAGGILLALAVLGIPTASGSTPYVGDVVDYVWVLGPSVLAIVVIGWPDRGRARSDRGARLP